LLLRWPWLHTCAIQDAIAFSARPSCVRMGARTGPAVLSPRRERALPRTCPFYRCIRTCSSISITKHCRGYSSIWFYITSTLPPHLRCPPPAPPPHHPPHLHHLLFPNTTLHHSYTATTAAHTTTTRRAGVVCRGRTFMRDGVQWVHDRSAEGLLTSSAVNSAVAAPAATPPPRRATLLAHAATPPPAYTTYTAPHTTHRLPTPCPLPPVTYPPCLRAPHATYRRLHGNYLATTFVYAHARFSTLHLAHSHA